MTTPRLKLALAEAAKLPKREQNVVASRMLREIDELRWRVAFRATRARLEQLADAALAQLRRRTDNAALP